MRGNGSYVDILLCLLHSLVVGVSGASQPLNCHQTCGDTYSIGAVTYLNTTCISCADLPQITDMSVFWQV